MYAPDPAPFPVPVPPGHSFRGDSSKEGFVIGGVPIGRTHFTQAFVDDFLKREAQTMTRLEDIKHLQTRLLLLRFCAVPACVHLLRGIPSTESERLSEGHDLHILSALAKLLNRSLESFPDESRAQASLPTRHGGLALTNTSPLCHLMYFSSLSDAVPSSRLLYAKHPAIFRAPAWFSDYCSSPSDPRFSTPFDAITALCSKSKDPLILSIPAKFGQSAISKLQSTLTSLYVDEVADKWYAGLTEAGKKRVSSIKNKESSAWLRAIPADRDLHIANEPMNARLNRWLGLPPGVALPPRCACGAKIDAMAHHLEWCKNGRRIYSHDVLVHELHRLMRDAGFQAPRMEAKVPDVFPRAGPRRFRVDLVYRVPGDDVLTIGDVSIRHPYNPSLRGDTLDQAQKDKNRRYGELCKEHGHRLQTLSIDQYGRWSEGLSSLVGKLCSSHDVYNLSEGYVQGVNWSAPTLKSYLAQRISVILQRNLGIKELHLIHTANKAASVYLPYLTPDSTWYRSNF